MGEPQACAPRAYRDAVTHLKEEVRLRDEFTVPEIVELLIWISFEYAGQLFG